MAGKRRAKKYTATRKATKMIKARLNTKRGLRYTGTVRSLAWHGAPFPPQLMTQFTYAENIQITSTVGVPFNYLYSSNSLYDPNVTATGTQPRFFDTMMGANATNAPYQNYRVYKSRITIEAIDLTDSINARGYIGVGFFPSTVTGPSTLAELRARSDFKIKYMGIYTGGKELCKITRVGLNKTIFGIKDMKDDEETQALYNASPAKAGRWCITYIPFNETSTVVIHCMVKITYFCQLFTRNDVQDS